MEAIFTSHNIEHLYPHEVPLAFAEFLRVLKPDGFFVVTCPDLQSVCALVAKGNLFMAHRCGFTQKVLDGTLRACGFQTVISLARGRTPFFDLWALASKSPRTEDEMRALAGAHFPK